jgi:hypothetical protein
VSGIIASAPVKVGPRGSNNRETCILRDHEAAERRNMLCRLDRQISFDEEWRPIFMQPIDGNGSTWRQRHTLRPGRFTLVR